MAIEVGERMVEHGSTVKMGLVGKVYSVEKLQ